MGLSATQVMSLVVDHRQLGMGAKYLITNAQFYNLMQDMKGAGLDSTYLWFKTRFFTFKLKI